MSTAKETRPIKPWEKRMAAAGEKLRKTPRDFRPGDIVAVYGQRTQYTVANYNKSRDELRISDGYHSTIAWAGVFYVVKKARYEDVAPPNEENVKAFASYLSYMGGNHVRFETINN